MLLDSLRHGSIYLHGPCRTYHTIRHGCAILVRGRSAVFFKVVHILITMIGVLKCAGSLSLTGKACVYQAYVGVNVTGLWLNLFN